MALKQSGWRMWPRVLCFLLIFAVVFFALQEVLRYKYQPEDVWAKRYRDYAAEPADTVDVVFIGNSQLYWGVSPMALYNEAGITSYNMSGNMFQQTTTLQQLKTLLTLNTPPKVVVFTPVALLSYLTATNGEMAEVYYSLIQHQPTEERKREIYDAMQAECDGQADVMPYVIPLLGFHSHWSNISANNFRSEQYFEERNEGFLKGQWIYLDIGFIRGIVKEEPTQTEPVELKEAAIKGFREFFALCEENGITPVALILPRYDGFYKGTPVETVIQWLDEEGILTFDYQDEVSQEEMGWSHSRHFIDSKHLNFMGSLHLATDLAYRLRDELDLADHRGEEGYESWDADVTAFFDAYREPIADELGESYAPWWDMEEEIW